jgi:hypothetical protein
MLFLRIRNDVAKLNRGRSCIINDCNLVIRLVGGRMSGREEATLSWWRLGEKRKSVASGRRLLIGVKPPQQATADRLILALAPYSLAPSKRQTRNGAAKILDAALRLRCFACAWSGCNADATQQTELLRFLKCSQ